jgi:hypothetical protein
MRSGRRSARRSARFGSRVEAALARVGSPADVLVRRGVRVRNRMSPCPIHDGGFDTPCLSLYRGRDGRERWKCHSCGSGGDALDLEAALLGRDVKDLIRELA